MSDWEALRLAARALTPERVIAALERAFAEWRAPHSPWRKRLAEELPLYSAPVLDLALAEGLRDWSGEALRELRAREISEPCRPPKLTAVWLAGSVPAGAFAAIALPLLAGSAVYAKPSSGDDASAELFAETLGAVDPAVGAAVAVGRDERALEAADAVVAHGGDATIAALRARVPPSRVFVGYGHKLSVGAVGPQVGLEDAACAAALDLALYDGRGCLSPAYLLVDDQPRGRIRAFGQALAAELERLASELPRGRLGPEEEAALRARRAGVVMSDACGVWASEASTQWSVMLAPPGVRPAPGALRNVPLVPVAGLDGLAGWCAGLAPHLSSLGQMGWGVPEGELAAIALEAGGSRVCPLGRMQLPPIDWRHDGMGPLEPLLRFVDIEPAPEPRR